MLLNPIFSPTPHDLFVEWKSTSPKTTWTEHLNSLHHEHVEMYEKLEWKLLCCGYDSKEPVKDVKWNERTLSYDNALILFTKKMNIAVNLKKSGLIVAEIDDRNVPPYLKQFMDKTITTMTPRGYHIFFKYDVNFNKNQLIMKLRKINLDYTMFRGCPNSGQYVLLPLSHVSNEKHGYHMRCYKFIFKDRLMDFSKIIK